MDTIILDEQIFYTLVFILAVFYVILVRLIRASPPMKKFLKPLNDLQEKSKELSKRMQQAGKEKNIEKVDNLMKEQMELTSKMFPHMLRIYGAMIPTLIVFFFFLFLLDFITTNETDDIHIQLQDNGLPGWCDAVANDSIYSACVNLNHTPAKPGAWVLYYDVYAQKKGDEQEPELYASDYVPLLFTSGSPYDVFHPKKNQDSMSFWGLDKNNNPINFSSYIFHKSDSFSIHLNVSKIKQQKNISKVEATLDSGTRIYVTIPIINYNVIGKKYVFIIFSFIASMVIYFILGKNQNKNSKI